MATYHVKWEMEIEASDPVEAAIKALEIHRDPNSVATHFTVTSVEGMVHEIDVAEKKD